MQGWEMFFVMLVMPVTVLGVCFIVVEKIYDNKDEVDRLNDEIDGLWNTIELVQRDIWNAISTPKDPEDDPFRYPPLP